MTWGALGDDANRATRGRSGRAIALSALLATFIVLGGCGQRGPLTLPASARPVERLDPAVQPAAQPAVPPAASPPPGGAAQPAPGATTGAPPEPQTEDDREHNGARQPENER